MPIQIKQIVGTSILSLAFYEWKIGRKLRRKNRAHVQLCHLLLDANKSLEEQFAYLLHLCNEKGIELDEFDLQVLPSIIQK